MYTLRTAAEAAGKGRPAIIKAIQKGRITATKNALGRYQIDPAELHRVYPLVKKESATGISVDQQEAAETGIENNTLKATVEHLRELLRQIEGERDGLKEDRDHWRRQATALLTSSQQEAKDDNRSWLARWLERRRRIA